MCFCRYGSHNVRVFQWHQHCLLYNFNCLGGRPIRRNMLSYEHYEALLVAVSNKNCYDNIIKWYELCGKWSCGKPFAFQKTISWHFNIYQSKNKWKLRHRFHYLWNFHSLTYASHLCFLNIVWYIVIIGTVITIRV